MMRMRSFRTLGLSCLFSILAMVLGHLPTAAGELRRDIPAVKMVIDTSAADFEGMEPSGLVPGGKDILYMVSDNGKIVKLTLSFSTDPERSPAVTAKAETLYEETDKKKGNFESVAIVPGKSNLLYVGIEGTGKNKPSIRELNLTTKTFTEGSWELKEVSPHVESMTFVPDGTAKKGFGGYFLAASSGKGTVYAYDLPTERKKNKTQAFGSAFTVNLPQAKSGMSDFYYFADKSVLYVAYDDENPGTTAGNQALWEYERVGTGKNASYGLIAQTTMPNPGLEAVTAITDADKPFPTVHLYTGLDISTRQPKQKNRIDLYSGYLTYAICGGRASKCSDIRGSHCGWCKSGSTDQPRAIYGSYTGPVTGSCQSQNWIWTYDKCN
jgi:hypothetical protein